MAAASEHSPRTLADELRGWDDARVVALLQARPDLINPVPADLAALVSRACSTPSVARALDRLDAFSLQAVDVLVLAPEPTSSGELAALLGADPRPALSLLGDLALVWGDDGCLRLVPTVRQLVANPAGLGPTLEDLLAGLPVVRVLELAAELGAAPGEQAAARRWLAKRLSNARALDVLLAEVSPAARELLDRLAEGPPMGSIEGADRRVRRDQARTPIDELLARGLLLPLGDDVVVLAREIAGHLRRASRGRLVLDPAPHPPPMESTQTDPRRVDATAAGAAFDAVRRVEELLEAWGVAGPPVLRSGGLGVRELRRTAVALDLEEHVATLLLEAAYAAGLLGASADADPVWLPTPAYDTWQGASVERRWTVLARAWLETPRVAGLVGEPDDRDRRVPALGYGLDRASAPALRSDLLAELAAVPAGKASAAESLRARLRWRSPRRGGTLRDALVGWTLREAEALGLTGLGALSTPGRALLNETDAAAAAALAPLLPEPLDYVLLQADLTAVAPGPLTAELGSRLALAADVESRGAATVYRFTESSVRRALDAGATASDLHHLLADHSRTPVPQPLTYLLDDVARRHGRIRVGSAKAYVRCDDPAVLAELLANRRAEPLRLRRLAPTVLAAQATVETLLERLRALGFAPAAENPRGEVVVRRPDSRRTPSRPRLPRLTVEPPVPAPSALAAAVRALRAGETARAGRSGIGGIDGEAVGVPLRQAPPTEILATLRSAAAAGRSVWIGYVNAEGRATVRVIEPLSIEGGRVSAYDHLRDQVRTFALHRITGLAEDPDPTDRNENPGDRDENPADHGPDPDPHRHDHGPDPDPAQPAPVGARPGP